MAALFVAIGCLHMRGHFQGVMCMQNYTSDVVFGGSCVALALDLENKQGKTTHDPLVLRGHV